MGDVGVVQVGLGVELHAVGIGVEAHLVGRAALLIADGVLLAEVVHGHKGHVLGVLPAALGYLLRGDGGDVQALGAGQAADRDRLERAVFGLDAKSDSLIVNGQRTPEGVVSSVWVVGEDVLPQLVVPVVVVDPMVHVQPGRLLAVPLLRQGEHWHRAQEQAQGQQD